ncbi:MAG: glycosyltransferase [Bacteriovoracia bacterium]
MTPYVDLFVLSYQKASTVVASVESVLDQTYLAKKVIVSENGSSDGSLERLLPFLTANRGLEVRVRRPGWAPGIFEHMNVCLAESTAPYVGFFHADDLYDPALVTRQIELFEQHPELGVVTAVGTGIGSRDEVLWPVKLPDGLAHPLLDPAQVYRHLSLHGNSFFLAPSALYRRSIFQELGDFSTRFPQSGDVEFFLRVLFSRYRMAVLPDPLIQVRFEAAQASARYDQARTGASDYFEVLGGYADRSPLSPADQRRADALRRLDQFQAELNRCARGTMEKSAGYRLEVLAREFTGDDLAGFGGVDRLKVRAVRAAGPLFTMPVGAWLARQILRQTDPRRSLWLQAALRLKRR